LPPLEKVAFMQAMRNIFPLAPFRLICFLVVFGCWLGFLSAHDAMGADTGGQWRLRVREAAVARGDTVLLGELVVPYGDISPADWQNLAQRPMWPAPPDAGKPMQITKARLGQALRERLGDLADRCLLPGSLAIQRGGAVLYEDDLRSVAVKTLTPLLANLSAHVELSDFRLPSYIFLAHSGQRVELEPAKPVPGRMTLRFVLMEMDSSVVRRFTGSVFANIWVDVPVAAKPLNRGDVLTPDAISHARKNLAYVKGEFWDGFGGPWQMVRAVGTGQPIFSTDIEAKVAVRKGSIITMVYSRGNVHLSVQAEAMSDGGPGDTITVRNMQTQKHVYASVQDAGTVIVK
jgi:flagella basal body P-ring formation protein FlgA